MGVEFSLESWNVAEAELVSNNEGSMWITVIARWYRSAGVEDRITYERLSSGTKRPGRVHQ
jgi:hypothetical protein